MYVEEVWEQRGWWRFKFKLVSCSEVRRPVNPYCGTNRQAPSAVAGPMGNDHLWFRTFVLVHEFKYSSSRPTGNSLSVFPRHCWSHKICVSNKLSAIAVGLAAACRTACGITAQQSRLSSHHQPVPFLCPLNSSQNTRNDWVVPQHPKSGHKRCLPQEQVE